MQNVRCVCFELHGAATHDKPAGRTCSSYVGCTVSLGVGWAAALTVASLITHSTLILLHLSGHIHPCTGGMLQHQLCLVKCKPGMLIKLLQSNLLICAVCPGSFKCPVIIRPSVVVQQKNCMHCSIQGELQHMSRLPADSFACRQMCLQIVPAMRPTETYKQSLQRALQRPTDRLACKQSP